MSGLESLYCKPIFFLACVGTAALQLHQLRDSAGKFSRQSWLGLARSWMGYQH